MKRRVLWQCLHKLRILSNIPAARLLFQFHKKTGIKGEAGLLNRAELFFQLQQKEVCKKFCSN